MSQGDFDGPLPPNVARIHAGRDTKDDQRPLAVKERQTGDTSSYCLHRRTELDTKSQRVYCRDCESEVTAFDTLLRLAREPERWIWHRKDAERRANTAEESLRVLLKIEANAKARVRTALKKLPECECPITERRYSPGPFCSLCGGVRK
jgi:hypothetical protein